ncbi:MAG: hypothetical protein C5B51_15120 [Terriglobia bacterium]|nr:MAG: hypothetical protein C5B51_15120 [Terriglobia bacterium]
MSRLFSLLCAIGWCALPAAAQRQLGELRLQVADPTGAALTASVELVSQAVQFRKDFPNGHGRPVDDSFCDNWKDDKRAFARAIAL